MVPMKQASTVNGWLFLLAMAAGFVSLLLPVGRFFLSEEAAWQQFRDGELVRRLERQVDEAFVLREPSIALWADMNFVLFRAGRPGVLVGENDWLFSREEFYYDHRSEQWLARNLPQIEAVACQLRRLDKALLVIPVPAKRRLYSRWASHSVSAGMEQLYPRLTASLTRAGVPWLDTLTLMEVAARHEPVFMRTDTHWSPHGASAVAEGVASRVPLSPQHAYRTQKVAEQRYQGDLLRYLPTSAGIGPQREEVLPRYQTASLTPAMDADALLGDVMPSVALVGTSYSAMDEWHFPGFLKQRLGQDVLVYALEAQGPFAAMREFLASPAARDERVQQVLWEVPERALIQSMEAVVEGEQHACLEHYPDHPAELAGVGSSGR